MKRFKEFVTVGNNTRPTYNGEGSPSPALQYMGRRCSSKMSFAAFSVKVPPPLA